MISFFLASEEFENHSKPSLSGINSCASLLIVSSISLIKAYNVVHSGERMRVQCRGHDTAVPC
ncbi:hypothetical protein QWZ13_11830 [Reinekea marina]|uniref:hypothetical protein n=1 Tax=Reinekea marina TaxID=1310421 RepID=UPI0025B4C62E|nr:hypothetical protein [Reinekea marina]MDN3649606.1 hypothetical protein [Reinekea marina]